MFLSRQGFYVQGHCDLDLLTPKLIGIIYEPWPTKKPSKVSPSSIDFKYWAEKDYMLKVTKTLGGIS